jgi:hypothetical protein
MNPITGAGELGVRSCGLAESVLWSLSSELLAYSSKDPFIQPVSEASVGLFGDVGKNGARTAETLVEPASFRTVFNPVQG